MASYVGHISFSSVCGAVYGGAAAYFFGMDWGPALLGAGLTTAGGVLPDLDSDSSVPNRELFSLGAVLVPLVLHHRLAADGFTVEQTLVILIGLYLVVRYGLSRLFNKFTVHRGIYHSIPAMLIAGLTVFLLYHSKDLNLRLYLAAGTMIGFLSHLVLDELCSVDFSGLTISLNQFAGSALKFFSASWPVNLATYALLGGLIWLALPDLKASKESFRGLQERVLQIYPSLPWVKGTNEVPPGR